MTMLAGVFSRRGDRPIEPSTCERLKSIISRDTQDVPLVFSDARCFLAKVDIGAHKERAFQIDPKGSISALAGEPLLDLGDNSVRSRTKDLELLHHRFDKTDWRLLTKTRGVFCAVHYQPLSKKLCLIADKLAVRPLYYWMSDDYVFFSSALRILESLDEVHKKIDLRAVTETTTLGYALADRTPYQNIRRLKAGEVVQIDDKSHTRVQYWRWDDITPSSLSEDKLLKDVYHSFTTAVTSRLRGETETVAMLSGGMDSRSVVTALCTEKVRVHTFNFSNRGTQDEVFSSGFASSIGTLHQVGPSLDDLKFSPEANAPWTKALATATTDSKYQSNNSVERPQLAWSGDGGSVGLGHVYISRPLAELLRQGKREEAIELYLKELKAHVVKRLLKSNIVDKLIRIPRDEIASELNDIHCEDPIRGFHIFLLLNDQRRHLDGHFEDIDLHRLEFQLPFFDGKFLAAVLAVPIDLCLHHRFYTKWFSEFPSVIKATPWQTYPGHEPCTVPISKELGYQWQNARTGAWELSLVHKHQWLEMAKEMLRAKDFPHKILNKQYLRFERWAYALGVRKNSEYVFKVARAFHKYWSNCDASAP